MVVMIYYYIGYKYKATTWYLTGFPIVFHIQRIGCQPEKTSSHGGQSRSWSAEQGKKNKRKSLAAYQPPTLLVRRNKNKHVTQSPDNLLRYRTTVCRRNPSLYYLLYLDISRKRTVVVLVVVVVVVAQLREIVVYRWLAECLVQARNHCSNRCCGLRNNASDVRPTDAASVKPPSQTLAPGVSRGASC